LILNCIEVFKTASSLHQSFLTQKTFGRYIGTNAIAPLPELSTAQVESVQQILSNSSVTFPRLAVPFTTWGGILENEQWRQSLYQQRQRSPFSSVPINLSGWLQQIYDASWQALETFLAPNTSSLAFNFRSNSGLNTAIKRAKLIDLGMEIEAQKVILLVALIPKSPQQVSIRVQLHPACNQPYLTANTQLFLLSEQGEILQQVQARVQDIYVQLKLFDGEVGECFSIQVALNSCQITEHFVI
jgi:hypothetical protein